MHYHQLLRRRPFSCVTEVPMDIDGDHIELEADGIPMALATTDR